MRSEAPAAVRTRRTIGVILGGGAGTRLFPLTKDRAKPAVPLAGKYRLVDIPLSNCINSGIERMYLLTQFQSASLHRHIQNTYKFDEFSRGFVEIMAAQQTDASAGRWYQGTADAVRQNLVHFDNSPHGRVVILSGDQLYRMDYRDMLSQHEHYGSEISVAVIPVNRAAAKGFGIMQIDSDRRIVRFVEKPKEDALLDSLRLEPEASRAMGAPEGEDMFLASMGIYVFNRDTLHAALNNDRTDFGKHIIPEAIGRSRIHAFLFQGYWEDLGTISAYYKANLDLCDPRPQFEYFDTEYPIFTRPRNLPPNKIEGAMMTNVAMCSGCRIGTGELRRVMVGNRTILGRGVQVEETVLMGCDYFPEEAEEGPVPLGIGDRTVIRKAIIDKNARIGRACRITPEGKPDGTDHPLFHVRDGIIVIPKNTVIPDNTVL